MDDEVDDVGGLRKGTYQGRAIEVQENVVDAVVGVGLVL